MIAFRRQKLNELGCREFSAQRRAKLHLACTQAGIEACSPNDLRQTYAKWMRLARVPAEIVAPTMGHRDTRMVERVYGRLVAGGIGALLSRTSPTALPVSQTKWIWAEKVDGLDFFADH